MITRKFQNLRLSGLGFGAMRLPVIDGDDNRIDREETFHMVDEAMAKGHGRTVLQSHGLILSGTVYGLT